MLKNFLRYLLRSHHQVSAAFLAVLALLTALVFTGFGLGSVFARSVPAAETAWRANSVQAQEKFEELSTTSDTTALLVLGADLNNPSTFDSLAKAFAPLRNKTAAASGLVPRQSLLDPFSITEANSAETKNPLVSAAGDAFLVIGIGNEETDADSVLKAFKGLQTELVAKNFGTSALLDSPELLEREVRWNSERATVVLSIVAIIATLVGFFFTTRRRASALTAALVVAASVLLTLGVLWCFTLLWNVPTSVIPTATMIGALIGMISLAILVAIEQTSAFEISQAMPRNSVLTLRRSQVGRYLAWLGAEKNLLLFTFLGTVLPFVLMLATRLNFALYISVVGILVSFGCWLMVILVSPCVMLSIESFSSQRRRSGAKAATTSVLSPLRELRGQAQRLIDRSWRREYAVESIQKFPVKLLAGALLLTLSLFSWIAVTPHSGSVIQLAGVQQSADFKVEAESHFPDLIEPDIMVIGQVAPLKLSAWTDSLLTEPGKLQVVSPPIAVNDQYSSVSLNFSNSELKFNEKANVIAQINSRDTDFTPYVYSQTVRDIETTSLAAAGGVLALLLTALFGIFGFRLIFPRWSQAALQLTLSFAVVAGAIGLAALASRWGLMRILSVDATEIRPDTTGLIIGGFVSMIITAIVVLESQYRTRPILSKTIWLMVSLVSFAALFSRQYQLITIAAVLLAAVALNLIAIFLVEPYLHGEVYSLADRLSQLSRQRWKRSGRQSAAGSNPVKLSTTAPHSVGSTDNQVADELPR